MQEDEIDYLSIDTESLSLFKNKGYWQFYMPGHPLAAPSSGCVMLHRHLMSVELGRWLNKKEFITFLDGNRENCELSNLKVVSRHELGKAAGKALGKPRKVVCLTCGKTFTPEGPYVRQRYCSVRCKAAGFLQGNK